MDIKLGEFITPYGNVSGVISIDERWKAIIQIDTYDRNIFDYLKNVKILNSISDNLKYCFSELICVKEGANISEKKCLFKFMFESFYFIEGLHCDNLDELQIESASTTFNYLDKWYKGTAYCVFSLEEKCQALSNFENIPYKMDVYNIDDKLKILLSCATDIINLEEHFNVTFQYKEGKLSDYIEAINKFARFLSLCCFTAVEVNDIISCNLESNKLIKIYRYKWIEETTIYPHFIVCYKELKENFETIISNYYKHDNLKQTISTLNSVFYIPRSAIGGISLRFLNCSKAIESLYSIKEVYDFSISEKEFKEKLTNILKKIECEEDKKFIKDKLCNSHKATFRMKLIQFFNNVKQVFIDNDEIINDLTSMIKNTRNYYTHIDLEDKNIINEKYLSLINSVLLSLLVCSLLWFLNDKKHLTTNSNYIKNSINSFVNLIQPDLKILCEKT